MLDGLMSVLPLEFITCDWTFAPPSTKLKGREKVVTSPGLRVVMFMLLVPDGVVTWTGVLTIMSLDLGCPMVPLSFRSQVNIHKVAIGM